MLSKFAFDTYGLESDKNKLFMEKDELFCLCLYAYMVDQQGRFV